MALIEKSFGYKNMWFALKNADIDAVLSACPNLTNAGATTWESGLQAASESSDKAFLSGVYDGWSFLVGLGICDPTQVESFMALISELGKCSDEICFFATHRVVELQCFAQAIQGKIVRYYCYSGESGHIYADMGERTAAEKKLSLNIPADDEELFDGDHEPIEETDILLLAEQMSMDPDMLIGMEEGKCIIADISRGI